MCNKCEVLHSKLFEDHQNYITDKNLEDIINEFCEEENHSNNKLNYFCKTHNKLCCAACIAKIKGKGAGQHVDCDVCYIDDIKEEKKKGIKENIKLLEELSLKFKEIFNDINKIFEEINANKEKLKLEIQKIFTNIRNVLNNREDELLLNVDKEYDNLSFKGNIIKDIEKLPDKIKLSVDKCKNINELDTNIYKLIKECTEVENNIKIINNINSNINNIYNSKNMIIKFIPEEKEMNEFTENIKNFGQIVSIDKNYNNFFKSSSIIKDDEDNINLIKTWILETIKKVEIKFELIFKMSENGTKSEDFHKYCDNKGPTLILVKTTNNKIFGGFTPLNWNIKKGDEKDLNNYSFIFSLNLKKKFDMIKKDGPAIYCSKIYGPNFGCADFRLNRDMKTGETYANSGCNFLRNQNLELTGGRGNSENFETEEFEAYKVIF